MQRKKILKLKNRTHLNRLPFLDDPACVTRPNLKKRTSYKDGRWQNRVCLKKCLLKKVTCSCWGGLGRGTEPRRDGGRCYWSERSRSIRLCRQPSRIAEAECCDDVHCWLGSFGVIRWWFWLLNCKLIDCKYYSFYRILQKNLERDICTYPLLWKTNPEIVKKEPAKC